MSLSCMTLHHTKKSHEACYLARTLTQHVPSESHMHKRADQMVQQQDFVACVRQCANWAHVQPTFQVEERQASLGRCGRSLFVSETQPEIACTAYKTCCTAI